MPEFLSPRRQAGLRRRAKSKKWPGEKRNISPGQSCRSAGGDRQARSDGSLSSASLAFNRFHTSWANYESAPASAQAAAAASKGALLDGYFALNL
jgi:hypothetical protein